MSSTRTCMLTIMMRAQITLAFLYLLFQHAAANTVLRKGSTSKRSHCLKSRQLMNHGLTMYEEASDANSPIEYLKTPNFEVMVLSEENTDPTWRKYAGLFHPKDLSNARQIEVNYGSRTVKSTDGLRRPSIRLDRSEVESVLASLGGKKHIIVLHPRHCTPHSVSKRVKASSLDEFENVFIPKFLQQLHKRAPEQQVGSDMVDPVIDRILKLLDKDEQDMLDSLKRSFDGPMESSTYPRGYTSKRRPSAYSQYGSNSGIIRNKTPMKIRTKHLKNVLLKDHCDEGYVFLVQNHKNSMDPNALNDLLLRVLKVVTQAA